MKFDERGRRDYELEDVEQHRRGRSRVGTWSGIESTARGVAVLLVIIAALLLSYGDHYLAGRAVGAGIRDAVSK